MYKYFKEKINKKHLSPYLAISFIISCFWILATRKNYEYNYEFYKIGDISLFPLLSWSLGLFAFFVLFLYIKNFIKLKNIWREFIFFILLYWFILISLETAGYHIFGITNLATSEYPGLPLCNCIHAPSWMQYAYFIMGPFYFSLCFLFDKQNLFIGRIKKSFTIALIKNWLVKKTGAAK